MKKNIFIIFSLFVLLFFISGCDFFINETTTNNDVQVTLPSVTTTSTDEVVTESDLTVQLQQIYQLAVEAEAFTGTYEEWLESVRGPSGDDGEAVVLSVIDNYIKWKYVSSDEWNELVHLDDLMGNDGRSVASTALNDLGEIIITYSDDTTENLGRLINLFQVTFYDYNGYFIESSLVQYGVSVTPPSNPEREGYTFREWSEDFSSVICNLNVYALYDINSYTVTFDSNGGSLIPVLEDIDYGSTILLQTPEKAGYTFLGWFLGETINDMQFTTSDVVYSDLVLYARWVETMSSDESNTLTDLGTQTVLNITDGDMEGTVEGFVFDGGNSDTDLDDTVHVAYKIATVSGDIMQQLSPWVSTDASSIEISTEKITEETITAGVSVSISTTVGVDFGVKVEATYGVTASLEYAITQATSNSITLTFPIEGYNDAFSYAVFLVGSYDVYQVLTTNLNTGLTDEYFFVKPSTEIPPSIRILSSNDTAINSNIDISDYKIKDFDLSMFRVPLVGDGDELSPYQIWTENDLYAMFFEPDAHYILMDNIDIEKFDGLQGVTFKGVLDGNDKHISNLNIVVDPFVMNVNYYYGFFSRIEGAHIYDLVFSFPEFNLRYIEDLTHAGEGKMHFGVLCGLAENSVIENITVQYANISNSRHNSDLGGIIGELSQGSITDSEVFASEIFSAGCTGGIVGRLEGLDSGNRSTMDNCKFYGTVEQDAVLHFYATGSYHAYGGIIGWGNYTTISNLTLDYVYLPVNGSFFYTPSFGLIAGEIMNSDIYMNTLLTPNCIASKSVTYDYRDSRYFAEYNYKFGYEHDNSML
ncbi:InlB B-repeat-containing protein [Candidatus Izemoplasma sp. B36]|uniref:InlB B-repeat-containing protein n=1 Tax=Candidatus Izemoplasma sp. B36 TaxID=3242468 RepID=UPI0035570B21